MKVEEDILTDTSNAFVDTMRFSNLYLAGIGGDYDGIIKVISIKENKIIKDIKNNFVCYGI